MIAILSCQKPLHFFDSEFSSKVDPFGEDKHLIEAFAAQDRPAQRVAWDAKGVDWGRFESVIIRSTWDYFVRYEDFLGTVDRIGATTQLFNAAPTIRWNAHKKYLADLENRGVDIVPTIFVPDLTTEAAYDVAKGERWGSFVVKPVVGGGAMETYRLPHNEQIFHQLNTAHCRDFMVQPYLPTIESEGEWSFLFFGGEFQYAIQKTPRAGDYRVQGIWGATSRLQVPQPEDLIAAKKVLAHVPEPTLYARVDMVRGESGKLLLMELELIEPFLSLAIQPGAAASFVTAYERISRE